MNADEFYALRDHRTSSCLSGLTDYQSAQAWIGIDATAATDFASQLSFMLAVNLSARWCRGLKIDAPSVPIDSRLVKLLPHPESSLDRAAIALAKAVDPFGSFSAGPAGPTDPHLLIGPSGAGNAICVAGLGWEVLVGGEVHRARQPANSAHAVGGALAGCVGAALLMRAALGEEVHGISARLSAWNFRGGEAALPGPRAASGGLGEVLLVGCGAVGSAMAFLLPLLGLSARFTLVDGDLVDVSNLNRSPIFLIGDVGLPKPEVVQRYLSRHGARAQSVAKWFDEAVADGSIFSARPDVVVPAANDRDVRHSIQHQLPPVQVYGATNRDWQAFLGRHVPLREDCLACRYPKPQTADDPPMACSVGSISTPAFAASEHADAALPFLSAAAAVLAVAELAKVSLQEVPSNPNFACLDLRGPLDDFFCVQRDATLGCICAGQTSAWHSLNAETRFARRSLPNC